MIQGIEASENALLGLSLNELEEWAITYGEPAYRGRQIHDWLYSKGVRDIEDITVLPHSLRGSLKQNGVSVGRLKEIKRLVSRDKTIKLLLRTDDNENVEAVGIPTDSRLTVCVSSQVGCAMGCHFCATGKAGFQRSLSVHEIVDQVITVREVMQRRPSNIVFMGMGEPLMNCDAVLSSIRCINEDLGIGQRRITVSTVGVADALPKLAELALAKLGRVQFTLAISLHAPNQELREELIPTARSYPIKKLLEDCRRYFYQTGRRVTFEYILIGGVNDLPEHAKELACLLGNSGSHVNLISYNPIGDSEFKRPTKERVFSFQDILVSCGIAVSVRSSRGLDQNAACGQLRHQHATLP